MNQPTLTLDESERMVKLYHYTTYEGLQQIKRKRLIRVSTGSVVHLDVEDTSEELLTPALLCHKEPARSKQRPVG